MLDTLYPVLLEFYPIPDWPLTFDPPNDPVHDYRHRYSRLPVVWPLTFDPSLDLLSMLQSPAFCLTFNLWTPPTLSVTYRHHYSPLPAVSGALPVGGLASE